MGMTLGEYVVVSGVCWTASDMTAFCMWLAAQDAWIPQTRDQWTRRHLAWRTQVYAARRSAQLTTHV